MRCLHIAPLLMLVACTTLTSVDAPDITQRADYNTAAGASALATGSMTRFVSAFGGAAAGNSLAFNQVLQSGQIADELLLTGTNLNERDWDSRSLIEPPAGGDLYSPLQNARINLLTAIGAVERSAPDSNARIGQLFALVGFTETFFGENFCTGVPLTQLDADFRPIYSQPTTRDQLFDQAVAHFDSAITHGADSSRILQLAQVGKGRALLNSGRFAQAAQAVSSVPTTYAYDATFVTGTIEMG
jgi:hypothetical protein